MYRVTHTRTGTFTSDEPSQTHNDKTQVLLFETEAGGVTKRTTVFARGLPFSSPCAIRDIKIAEATPIPELWILPAGLWATTSYDGDPLKYWSARGRIRDCPKQELLGPLPTRPVGPYELYWGHSGWEKGGHGIDPYWFDWRHSPMGYFRAFQEASATAMRMRCFYLDTECRPKMYPTDNFALKNGHDTPDGFHYDYDLVRSQWRGFKILAKYEKIDGQHYHRAYRAALALKDVDPFCKWLCENYRNHMHHRWCQPSDQSYFWNARQVLAETKKNPGPNDFCGREMAHIARLEWTLAPLSVLSSQFEDIIRFSSDPDTGVPYLTTTPHESGGAYEWWPEGTPVAQTFQWHLLLDAMKMRTGLREEVHRFENYFNPQSRWVMDNNHRSAGGAVPFMHLMRGDLAGFDYNYWVNKTTKLDRHAYGSQPLDYMPWRLHALHRRS